MRTRPRAIALTAALVAAAAVAAILVWQLGGGDDERDAVASLPGVRAATDDGSGGLLVSFEAAAGTDQVERVLGRLDDDDTQATLRLGRASLEVDDESLVDGREAARLLVAAGGAGAGEGPIDLDEGSDAISIRATPGDRSDAPGLARSLVLAISDDGRWPEGVELMTVAPAGAPAGEEPVAISHPLASTRRLAALLGAAAGVPDRDPRIVITTGHVELRVLASGTDDARKAWDDLASRVLPIGGFEGAETYVDVPGEGEDGRRPLVSGKLEEDPETALGLIDRMKSLASRAFATTDLSYVEGELAGPLLVEPLARNVDSMAPSDARLKVEWRGGIQKDGGEVEDSPAGVARLGPGIAHAAREGLEVAWSRRPGESGPAQLALSVPARFRGPAIGSLIGHPDKLRGLVRTLRTVAWPGTARFELSLGDGTCEDLPTVAALVAVVSTSDGPARRVGQSNDCSSEAAVEAVRRAWNATATVGAAGS